MEKKELSQEMAALLEEYPLPAQLLYLPTPSRVIGAPFQPEPGKTRFIFLKLTRELSHVGICHFILSISNS